MFGDLCRSDVFQANFRALARQQGSEVSSEGIVKPCVEERIIDGGTHGHNVTGEEDRLEVGDIEIFVC